MTPKERAAMQQALEALDVLLTEPMAKIAADKAEALLLRAAPALREALAEPELNLNCKSVQKRLATVWGYVKAEQAEQEPVGNNDWKRVSYIRETLNAEQAEQEPVAWYSDKGGFNECGEGQPLYAAPVRTKDLTDGEVKKIWRKHGGYVLMPIDFARDVIAAYKEKNHV